MSKKIYNFSAGPSTLPKVVLKEIQQELLDLKNSGMSVMEISHRSDLYNEIYNSAKSTLIELMEIPNDYEVLFLQGGASHQFMMVPYNLAKKGKIDFIETGNFSKKALAEAKKFADVNVLASSSDKTFSYIPNVDTLEYNDDCDYLHITTNNTIFGTTFHKVPPTKANIVADMSSNILSEKMDISKYSLIYAGAQKNLGIAGVTVVIIKKELIEERKDLPTMLSYKTHADGKSSFNTPPVFAIYTLGKVLNNLKAQGIENVYANNMKKAQMLYDYIDNSKLFNNPVAIEDRSIMNVTFKTEDDELNKKFIKDADEIGLKFIKGHRSVGGMRASIYNSMEVEGVETLIDFMKKFEEGVK